MLWVLYVTLYYDRLEDEKNRRSAAEDSLKQINDKSGFDRQLLEQVITYHDSRWQCPELNQRLSNDMVF